MFWPTSIWLFGEWATTTGPYSHGLVWMAFIVWRLWLGSAATRNLTPGSDPLAMLALLPLTMLWLFCWASGVSTLQAVVLPLIAISTIGMVAGRAAMTRTAGLILLIYLAMPVWTPLVPVLQAISTYMAHLMVGITGTPVHLVGNIVSIPSGSFVIVGGCSGLGFFLTSLAFSSAYSIVNRLPGKATALLVVLSGGVAMIANWIRISVIIYIGHLTEMQSPLIDNHLTFGWVVFCVANLLLLFFLRNVPLFHPDSAETDEVPARRSPAVEQPLTARGTVIAVLLLVWAPILASSVAWRTLQQPDAVSDYFDVAGLAACSGNGPAAEGIVRRSFAAGDDCVDVLLIDEFADLRGGDMPPLSTRLTGDVPTRAVLPGQVQHGNARRLTLQYMSDSGMLYEIWYWHEAFGRKTTDPRLGKLLAAAGILGMQFPPFAIAVETPCEDSLCRDGRLRLTEFLDRTERKPGGELI